MIDGKVFWFDVSLYKRCVSFDKRNEKHFKLIEK